MTKVFSQITGVAVEINIIYIAGTATEIEMYRCAALTNTAADSECQLLQQLPSNFVAPVVNMSCSETHFAHVPGYKT